MPSRRSERSASVDGSWSGMAEHGVVHLLPLQILPLFVDAEKDLFQHSLVGRLDGVERDVVLPETGAGVEHDFAERCILRVLPVEDPFAETRRVDELRDGYPGVWHIARGRRTVKRARLWIEVEDVRIVGGRRDGDGAPECCRERYEPLLSIHHPQSGLRLRGLDLKRPQFHLPRLCRGFLQEQCPDGIADVDAVVQIPYVFSFPFQPPLKGGHSHLAAEHAAYQVLYGFRTRFRLHRESPCLLLNVGHPLAS